MHPILLLLVGMAVVVGAILLLRLPAFLALLLGALVVTVATAPEAVEAYALARDLSPEAARALVAQHPVERIASGFGATIGRIGIIIAMASIIGACLLESGAAERVVRAALRLFGERRAGTAFLGSGFLLSIPVFADTVFYLMIPLAKSLTLRSGRNYLLYVLAIVAGAGMAHSLVPPTPGPLFVAAEFGVPLVLMIVTGCVVGLVAAGAGYGYARWANSRWVLPLREPPEARRKLEEIAARSTGELPPLGASLLPVAVPVVLIAGAAATDILGWTSEPPTPPVQRILSSGLAIFGEQNLALMLGAAIALLILVRSNYSGRSKPALQDAISSAGVIILIVGAGGAFGQALQQTGIAQAVEELSADVALGAVPLAFLLTALVRTAQGSSTVAMITAAGAIQGLASPEALGFHPVYLALAIGCGSKPIPWMNDSGFWVMTEMSGMTPEEGLRSITPQVTIEGIAGLAATMMGAAVLPLV